MLLPYFKYKLNLYSIYLWCLPYVLFKVSYFFKVKTSECFWTLEDGELHITLQKL